VILAFAWVAAGALLLAAPQRGESAATHALETAMNEPTTADLPPLRSVTLTVDNRPLVITPADAEQIASALQRYLSAHESTDEGVPLPRDAGQPWVDSRGALRVGTWTLGSRGDGLVLTLRNAPQQGATSGHQFAGSVVLTANGWQVPSIGLSRMQYR
jgi:hypothetical protein